MPKFNEPIDIQEISRRIRLCNHEDDLDEISDLVESLAHADKITASQYMYLEDQLDDQLHNIAWKYAVRV